MKLIILSEEELDKLEFVESYQIKKSKYDPKGLFSEQIFGPLQSYKCWCRETTAKVGEKCPTCGIEITSSNKRRTTFAKIKVDRIVHPVAMQILSSFPKTKSLIDKLLSGRFGVKYDENGILQTVESNINNYEDGGDHDLKLGLDAILEIAKFLVVKVPKSKTIGLIGNIINDNKFFVDYVLVIPPSYRPVSLSTTDSNVIIDEINKYYLTILNLIKPNLLNYKMKTLYEIQLQKTVIELYKYIINSIGKKNGLLRNHMAGRRIDFSGRAVITPDATLSLNEVRIPRIMLLQLWQLEIIRELLQIKKFASFKYAYNYLQDMYLNQSIDDEISNIIDTITTGQIVLLNRQPTLHRGSIMSFKVIPGSGFSIGLNPLVCDPFNADFDGDQMAVYRVLNKLSIKEAENKMLPSNNLYSSSDGYIQYSPKQDIVYGLYKISLEKKEIIEDILGHEVTSTLTKKKLTEYIAKDAIKDWHILDKLKDVGFAYTLSYPSTLSISDFEDIPIKNISGNWVEDSKKLDDHTEVLRRKFPKSDVIESGARASWDQVRQMVTSRGYVSDFLGNVIDHYISNSYSQGLSQEDFFYSCHGTRKALLDTALNVSDSGYLTRRLVYSSSNSKLGPVLDCGTKNTIELVVNSKLAKSLKYRNYYLKDPKIYPNTEMYTVKESDMNNLIGKKIYLRSPITCKSDKICKTCYGNLNSLHKSPYIGFIASQALGERSTQLILRTFHTGGIAQGQGEENQDIVSAISQVTSITDRKKKINSMSEIIKTLLDLYSIYKDYGDIHLVHFEVLLEQLIFNIYPKSNSIIKFRYDLDSNEEYRYDYTWKMSIKSVPAINSWFLGTVFENTRKNLIAGLIDDKDIVPNILESIIIGRVNE